MKLFYVIVTLILCFEIHKAKVIPLYRYYCDCDKQSCTTEDAYEALRSSRNEMFIAAQPNLGTYIEHCPGGGKCTCSKQRVDYASRNAGCECKDDDSYWDFLETNDPTAAIGKVMYRDGCTRISCYRKEIRYGSRSAGCRPSCNRKLKRSRF